MGGHDLCEWSTLGVKALIERQPTADVSSRAEVAREIFEEIERETKNHGIAYTQRKIAQLKKKYTEEKK